MRFIDFLHFTAVKKTIPKLREMFCFVLRIQMHLLLGRRLALPGTVQEGRRKEEKEDRLNTRRSQEDIFHFLTENPVKRAVF